MLSNTDGHQPFHAEFKTTILSQLIEGRVIRTPQSQFSIIMTHITIRKTIVLKTIQPILPASLDP